jgi:hypothetical protein
MDPEDVLFAAFTDEFEKIAISKAMKDGAKKRALDQARAFMDSGSFPPNQNPKWAREWHGKATDGSAMREAAARRIRQARAFGASEAEVARKVKWPAIRRHKSSLPLELPKPASAARTKAIEEDFGFGSPRKGAPPRFKGFGR